MHFYTINQLKYWKMMAEEEEVIHYYSEEVTREGKHSWLEEWHTVLHHGVCVPRVYISVADMSLKEHI